MDAPNVHPHRSISEVARFYEIWARPAWSSVEYHVRKSLNCYRTWWPKLEIEVIVNFSRPNVSFSMPKQDSWKGFRSLEVFHSFGDLGCCRFGLAPGFVCHPIDFDSNKRTWVASRLRRPSLSVPGSEKDGKNAQSREQTCNNRGHRRNERLPESEIVFQLSCFGFLNLMFGLERFTISPLSSFGQQIL